MKQAIKKSVKDTHIYPHSNLRQKFYFFEEDVWKYLMDAFKQNPLLGRISWVFADNNGYTRINVLSMTGAAPI